MRWVNECKECLHIDLMIVSHSPFSYCASGDHATFILATSQFPFYANLVTLAVPLALATFQENGVNKSIGNTNLKLVVLLRFADISWQTWLFHFSSIPLLSEPINFYFRQMQSDSHHHDRLVAFKVHTMVPLLALNFFNSMSMTKLFVGKKVV